MNTVTEPIASLSMAAEFLGVSRQTIHTWRKKGILPEYRYGKTERVCFKWSDLEKCKDKREAEQSIRSEK